MGRERLLWYGAHERDHLRDSRSARGNATNAPLVTFGGFPNVNYGRSGCCSSIAVDPSNNIYSANQGANTVTQWSQSGSLLSTLVAGPNGAESTPQGIAFDSAGNLFEVNTDVGTASVYAPGQTTPTRKFFEAQPLYPCNLTGIAVDSAGHAFISDLCNNAILEFPANASGSTTPLITLSGGGSGLSSPRQIAIDYANNLYVANSGNNTITIYGNGLLGNGTPTATIAGSNTHIATPTGVAVDVAGYVYVLNNSGNSITVYAPGQTGNVAPVRTIALNYTGTGMLAVDPYQNVYVNAGGGLLRLRRHVDRADREH